MSEIKFATPMGEYAKGVQLGLSLEREAILRMLHELPFCWDGDKQVITLDKRDVIAMIARQEK